MVDRTLDQKQKTFFDSQNFALVGASSKSDDHYGNKVLRWLIQHYGSKVVPVHLTAKTLEKISCVTELSKLSAPEQTALGIVTKPCVTRKLLQKAIDLKLPMIWIQPGAENSDVREYIKQAGIEDRVIYSHAKPKTIASCNQEAQEGSAQNYLQQDVDTGPPCGSDARPDIIENGNKYFENKKKDDK